jgi:hypothetical protein
MRPFEARSKISSQQWTLHKNRAKRKYGMEGGCTKSRHHDYLQGSFSPTPGGFHSMSKKTGGPMSADDEVKARRYGAGVKAERN